VSDELANITGKYFEQAQEARVTFAKSRLGFHCDINLHAGRGLTLRGESEATDAYAAFDKAAVHVGKRLRRYRRRVNDHARDDAQRARPEAARQMILAAEAEDHEEAATGSHAAPAVVAETTTEIAHLSVSEAVMRMELADHPVLMFRDLKSGVLNVVYRRADGNIGWIDPGD
jgi:ribosomal subunit interface protein